MKLTRTRCTREALPRQNHVCWNETVLLHFDFLTPLEAEKVVS
jgi:hypothetical protein